MGTLRFILGLVCLLSGLSACASDSVVAESDAKTDAATPARSQITLGNGEANWIITEGATRDGATITFPEVKIDGGGWLVLHPFRDGKPYGKIYVGAAYVSSGTNKDVAVTVSTAPEPAPGTMYLVMLHRDVNDNKEFDFVFVDEQNVLDKAVFEGTTMVAHPFPAP